MVSGAALTRATVEAITLLFPFPYRTTTPTTPTTSHVDPAPTASLPPLDTPPEMPREEVPQKSWPTVTFNPVHQGGSPPEHAPEPASLVSGLIGAALLAGSAVRRRWATRRQSQGV
jgi:hypothetical protein